MQTNTFTFDLNQLKHFCFGIFFLYKNRISCTEPRLKCIYVVFLSNVITNGRVTTEPLYNIFPYIKHIFTHIPFAEANTGNRIYHDKIAFHGRHRIGPWIMPTETHGIFDNCMICNISSHSYIADHICLYIYMRTIKPNAYIQINTHRPNST